MNREKYGLQGPGWLCILLRMDSMGFRHGIAIEAVNRRKQRRKEGRMDGREEGR